MLTGNRRITVASPYLERLKALAGGRRRGIFGMTADTDDALVIRIFADGIERSKSWWITESVGIKLAAAASELFSWRLTVLWPIKWRSGSF